MPAIDQWCPFHPSTFPLPTPIPANNIGSAIEAVERIVNHVIDPTNVVS